MSEKRSIGGRAHRFGGDWTTAKLNVIAGYLGSYTTALKDKPSEEHSFVKGYIDALQARDVVTHAKTIVTRTPRLSVDEQGPKRLTDAVDAYLTAKRIRCSARTIELEEERLSIVKKHFGEDVLLSAITATAIADFQRARHDAGIANRTINMDVGVLSRVLKFCGRWRALADHVKNLPERQRPIGRALTSEERRRLFDVAASNPE
jgi:hypothetical protein